MGDSVLVPTRMCESTLTSNPGLCTAQPFTTPDPEKTRPFGLGPGFLPEVTSKTPLRSHDMPKVAGGSLAMR